MFSTLKPGGTAEHPQSEDRVREAVDNCAVAYITALRALLETYGKDAIRGALTLQANRGRLWFNPFGNWLIDASLLPSDLTDLYGNYLDYEKRSVAASVGEPAAEHRPRVPTRMPLEKARVAEPEDQRSVRRRVGTKRTA